MIVHIQVESMKAAEQLSGICKNYSEELFLRSDKFCIDPKSTLGILAMMYSARDSMYLDTGEVPKKPAKVPSPAPAERPAEPDKSAEPKIS